MIKKKVISSNICSIHRLLQQSSGFVLFVVLACATTIIQAETELSFGVFPYMPSQQTLKIYGPVASDFSEKLKTKVRLKTAANFVKFERNLAKEIYDIAVIQPFDYPNVVDKYNYLPVARISEDLVTEFIVREDSEFSTIQGLIGSRIAFPPVRAANSQMGILHLRSENIDMETDVTVTYQKSHESCLQQVWLKKAAACVTAKPMRDLFESKRNVKFKVLAQTEIIPHVLYVVHKRVPEAQKAILLQTILEWSENKKGQRLVQSMGFVGFSPAKDDQYEILRQLTRVQPSIIKQRDRNELSFGVFPYFPPKKMAQLYGTVPATFSRALDGVNVRLKTAKSYEQFSQNINDSAYDIILIQPFDYYRVAALGFKAVARVSGDISGAIYVKQDSPIKDLAQLKGKKLSMPPREAAVTHLILYELKSKNLWAGRDLILDYKNTHLSCLQQMQKGASVACATSDQVLGMLGGKVTENTREIFKTKSIPHLVLMVSPSFPEDMRDKLTREVLHWKETKEGLALLTQIKLDFFIPFEEKDYTALKSFQ